LSSGLRFVYCVNIEISLHLFVAKTIITWDTNPARPDTKEMLRAVVGHDQPAIPGLMAASDFIVQNAKLGDAFTYHALVSQTSEVIPLYGFPVYLGTHWISYHFGRAITGGEI
jgi:hypothetical protein